MYIERRIYGKIRDHLKYPEIIVITGMRRSGKTTVVRRLLEDIESKNKVYLDMQRADIREVFKEKNYDNILLEIEKQFGLKKDEKMFIAVDEIQLAPELPGIVKYLYDHHGVKFILTGSSSFYMKNLFSESLAGRKIIFELYPLDFAEFLDFKNIRHIDDDFTTAKLSALQFENLKKHYEEFIEFGGFPQVVLADSIERKKELLADIISSYLSIDVESLADFRKKEDFYDILKVLAARVGCKLDNAKLSRIMGISAQTLRNYLKFFEDTYLINRIPVLTRNRDRELVKSKKLYFIDNGLANMLADLSGGAKFENAVFTQLRQKGEVRYFSLKSGREIDFILKRDKELTAFEAKETPTKIDFDDLTVVAKAAEVPKYRLVGRHLSPNFDDYIWGGSIR